MVCPQCGGLAPVTETPQIQRLRRRMPGTEGSSDPPRCRGLGQHFDADIANGRTSLPVWPELLYDLCERARCRFCLLVCFVLLFLLAVLC